MRLTPATLLASLLATLWASLPAAAEPPDLARSVTGAAARVRTLELRAGTSRDAIDQHIWRAFGPDPASPRLLRIEDSAAKRTTISDGVRAIVIDEATRTFREVKPEDAAASAQDWCIASLRSAGLAPSAQVRDGFTYERAGEETLDGHPCDIVRERVSTTTVVEIAGGTHTVPVRALNTYAISRTDGLPRRFEQRIGSSLDRPDLDPPTSSHLSILSVDAEIPAARFTLPTAEELEARGYARAKPPERPKPPAPRGRVAVGSAAPDFTLRDLDGREVALGSLRGKVVVLDFWASWCGPCKRAMPFLEEIHRAYESDPATKGKVVVLGMNTSESDAADARRVIKEKALTYLTLLDADATSFAYGVTGLPALFVIDTEGRVTVSDEGFGAEGFGERMRSAIDAALKSPAR